MSKPIVELDKVEQTIELDEIFGIDFSDKRELKEYIGQLMLDKIRERTANGIGINGRPLKAPYSKTYSESMEFKAFGKSKGKVNMTLSGDMLGLMDIVDMDDNKITIGWDDDTEIAKAYNHNAGDTVPKRPFFGLNDKELKEIARELKPTIKSAVKTLETSGRSKFQDKVLKLIDDLSDDGEG